MPSQRQLRWSQLRVGVTVVLASITLALLIFLMSGSTGLFTKKITLRAYFDSASGLRVGAPVRLQDVDIGNVSAVRIVPDRKQTPVEVRMRVSDRYAFGIRKDSRVTLNTAGVLGETYVYIDSTRSKREQARDNDELPIEERPDIQDVVKSSQSTLVNMQALLQRADRILAPVENGEGSIGKLLKDEELYQRLNSTVREAQFLVGQVSQGKGSIGKLLVDETLYNKVNASVDKLNKALDDVNTGQGTLGKFVKDPSLYNNANQTIAKASRLMDDVNAGKGMLGKFTRDEAFAAKIDTTVTKLAMLTDRLEQGQGTAGKFFADPTLYNNANSMLLETRSLVQAVRENPKRYLTIHFKLF